MNKLFLNVKCEVGSTLLIDGDDARHLIKSLRYSVGDEVLVSNSVDSVYRCRVIEINKNSLETCVEEVFPLVKNNIKISLFQCIPKANKLELIIQKAVELGVQEITPVVSDNCVVKLNDEKSTLSKLDRWNKIALEAAKQCGRDDIPVVNMPIKFKQAIENMADMDLAILPYEAEDNYSIKSAIREKVNDDIVTVGFLVGPEGGFDPSEIEYAKMFEEIKICTLGNRILRCETAAISMMTIVNYELGDLN